MQFIDVRKIKKLLHDYREEERNIENQNERLDRLETKLYSVGSPNLTALPKSPSPGNDMLTDMIAKRDEMKEKIGIALEKQKVRRAYIDSVIDRMTSSDEKAVVQMRYLDNASWENVTYMLFGGNEDYLDKELAYERRVYRIHGSALCNMQRIADNDDLKNNNEEDTTVQ